MTAGLDIIRDDMRAALDPVQLIIDMGLQPDPWQIAELRSTSRRQMWTICRQAGKSTTAAVRAAHQVMYKKQSLALVISPSQRQSIELFKKIYNVIYIKQPNNIMRLSELKLELHNKSRVVALPSSELTVRGYSAPDLIIVDEAAFTSDDLMAALIPMMAANPKSKLLCISTPNGKRGWYYNSWIDDEMFTKTLLTWKDCPRITPEVVSHYERLTSELMRRQEFDCEFLDPSQVVVFPDHLVERAMRTDLDVPAFLNDW
jgi:hypothetical protein